MQQKTFSAWRAFTARTLGVAATAIILAACSRGDVGAPCNHGLVEPPDSQIVTFPATGCDQLLCIYGDEDEAIDVNCTPGDDDVCNPDPTVRKFECAARSDGSGACRLRADYYLERSMCSKKCNSDEDCANGGVGNSVVVDDTRCETGFSCAIIQTLGSLCCQGMCVCRDDLGTNEDIARSCSSGLQEGCCTPIAGVQDEDNFMASPACGGGS